MTGDVLTDLFSSPEAQYRIAFLKSHPWFTLGLCLAGVAMGLLKRWASGKTKEELAEQK